MLPCVWKWKHVFVKEQSSEQRDEIIKWTDVTEYSILCLNITIYRSGGLLCSDWLLIKKCFIFLNYQIRRQWLVCHHMIPMMQKVQLESRRSPDEGKCFISGDLKSSDAFFSLEPQSLTLGPLWTKWWFSVLLHNESWNANKTLQTRLSLTFGAFPVQLFPPPNRPWSESCTT